MKKIRMLSIMLFTFVLMGMIHINVKADESYGSLTYNVTDDYVNITGVNGSPKGIITIPDTIDGKPVKIIQWAAFQDQKYITSVTIPDSVTTIGPEAFKDCDGLTSIIMPDSVTSIDWEVFSGCDNLTNVVLSNSLTTIPYYVFRECTSLREIVIPSSVTSISWGVFYACKNINVTIPPSVTDIHEDAFFLCESPTIYGYTDSYAETYAKTNKTYFSDTNEDINFVSIGTYTPVAYKTPTCPHATTEIRYQKNATCAAEGYTGDTFCASCGEALAEGQIIPKTSVHTSTEIRNKKAATCAAEGYTGDTYCKICGKKIATGQLIPKTSVHSFGAWKVTKAATVFATGTQTRTCTVCKKVEKKSISKLKPSIKLSKTSITLKKKKTYTVTVSKLAKGDSVKSWKSSNKKIATVTSKGSKCKITAKKKGKATITVTLKSGKKATVNVTVK